MPNDLPVPPGLLRIPQRFDTIPYEMRIIKTLVFRVFGSSEAKIGEGRISCALHCCTYPLSSPLVTQYVHYYDDDCLQIKYRIGLVETYVNLPQSTLSTLLSGNRDSQTLYE